MTIKANVEALATALGTDVGLMQALVNGGAADLSALTTTEKTNLVLAMNELKSRVDAAGVAWGQTETDGRIQAAKGSISSPALDKWASTQDVVDHVAAREAVAISAATTAAVNQITNGAGAAYDTLIEIQNELQADDTVITGILAALENRLRFDASQTLTEAQQITVCTNAGVGDPTFDYAGAYQTAKVAAGGA